MQKRSHSFQTPKIKLILYQLMYYFFLASIIGWLWEVLLMFVKEGQFRNRGFLYGPWLPVYGCGAVFFYVLLHRFHQKRIFVFLLSLVSGTCLELLAGWMLDHFWGKRYWDYTDLPFNLHGYVCLLSALAFGAAGLVWVCWGSRVSWELACSKPSETDTIPRLWIRVVLWVLAAAFSLDLLIALMIPNSGHGVTF